MMIITERTVYCDYDGCYRRSAVLSADNTIPESWITMRSVLTPDPRFTLEHHFCSESHAMPFAIHLENLKVEFRVITEGPDTGE